MYTIPTQNTTTQNYLSTTPPQEQQVGTIPAILLAGLFFFQLIIMACITKDHIHRSRNTNYVRNNHASIVLNIESDPVRTTEANSALIEPYRDTAVSQHSAMRATGDASNTEPILQNNNRANTYYTSIDQDSESELEFYSGSELDSYLDSGSVREEDVATQDTPLLGTTVQNPQMQLVETGLEGECTQTHV